MGSTTANSSACGMAASINEAVIPNGFQQITSLSAAASLTVPAGSTTAVICAESQDVRWRDDGTNPTASVGMVIVAGTATITAGTGFTERGRLGANPTWGAIEEKAQTTAGSIAATWTLGTAHKYIASLVALRGSGPAISPPTISGSLSKTCFVRLACSYQISASNTPTSYGATGLPSGLSLNASTGLISGSVTTQQKATVALSATNSGGTGNANLSLTIAAAGSAVKTIKTDRRGVRGGNRIGH